MKQQFRRTALASLVMLMSATALVACGGGDDPAPAVTNNNNNGNSPVAFATPSADTATAEGGFISHYSYVETTSGGKTQAEILQAVTGGVARYGHTIGGNQGWAGAALRFFAPGNADDSGTSTFNASSKTTLKIKMSTTTSADTSMIVMLHPFNADNTFTPPDSDTKPDFDGNGCAYKATLTLTAPTTSTEYSIPLSSFAYPVKNIPNNGDNANCAATAPALSSTTGNLYGIDVRNEAKTDGTHDVKVEYIKFQ